MTKSGGQSNVAEMTASPAILSVKMLDANESGVPVEIQRGSSTVNKIIPNGRGLSRLNIILIDGAVSDAELVTEKI